MFRKTVPFLLSSQEPYQAPLSGKVSLRSADRQRGILHEGHLSVAPSLDLALHDGTGVTGTQAGLPPSHTHFPV